MAGRAFFRQWRFCGNTRKRTESTRRRNNIATFIRHEPCPSCGSRNNLGRYSDGSAFCFGCRYTERPSTQSKLRNYHEPTNTTENTRPIKYNERNGCTDYPPHIVSYLAKYGISIERAISCSMVYDKSWDQLVYLFRDKEGRVACTQARNFNSDRAAKAKYYNVGNKEDVLPIYKKTSQTEDIECSGLVITEDALSAIRIASTSDAMPALGTSLSTKKIMALKPLYSSIIVWLDKDKWKEGRDIADRFKLLGLSARAIITDLDPKCYSDEQIKEYLK